MSPPIREVVGRSPVAPTLSILRGLKAGRIYELLGDSISIGRNSKCDLVLPDEVVSRNHARLRARSDGIYLEDLHSRNGTFINGRRVDQPTKLQDGDYIQVYELLLSFHSEGVKGPGSGLHSPLIQEELADWSAEDSGANMDRTVNRPRRRGRSSAIIMTMDASWAGPERAEVNAETKLQAVLEITRNLGSTLDLDHVLSRILDSVFRFFPQADHGYILKAEAKGGLRPAVIKHRERGGAPSTIRPIARTIAKQVLSEAKAILSSDVIYDKQNGEMPSSVLETEHRSMMCAPLMGPSQTPLGIIYIDTEDSQKPFSADDLDVLVCIAILAGQAMEQASVSEARYRAVVDAAADGILTIDDQGIIQSINPAIERLFGYTKRELVGEAVSRLSAQRENGTPKSPKGFFEEDQQTTLGNVRETTGRRKDGKTFPLSISVAELELDGQRLTTGIVQDITDRKRAEQ
ncbi:MAG: PAS domain S-box protein, partial [Planctomycetaceae bacterium]|nr:PAS domain S-box protein [Planctomycetaceae bacterium]